MHKLPKQVEGRLYVTLFKDTLTVYVWLVSKINNFKESVFFNGLWTDKFVISCVTRISTSIKTQLISQSVKIVI